MLTLVCEIFIYSTPNPLFVQGIHSRDYLIKKPYGKYDDHKKIRDKFH